MPIPTLGILDIKIAINFYHKILIDAQGQILGLYTVSAKANKSEVGTRVRLPTLRHSTGGGGHVAMFHQLTQYSCPQGAREVRKVYHGCFRPSTAVLAGFLFTVLLSKLAYRFFHSARAVSAASSHLLYLGLVFCQPTSRPFVNSRPFVDSRTFVDSCTGRFPRGPK